MLRKWKLRVVSETTAISLADKTFQHRAITFTRRPSAFYKPRESTPAGANLKPVKDDPSHTSIPPARTSSSPGYSDKSGKDDASHLLAKVEPTLALKQRNGLIRKHVVGDDKTTTLTKVRKFNIKDAIVVRKIRANVEVGTQDAPKIEEEDAASIAKAAEVTPHVLSSTYRFDPERQLLCATAVRRPFQIRDGKGMVIEEDQHAHETFSAEHDASEPLYIDLSRRLRARPSAAAVRSRVMARRRRVRRNSQSIERQFRKITPERFVLIKHLVKMKSTLRAHSSEPNAKKTEEASNVTKAPRKRRITRRRQRSVYLLRVMPSTAQSTINRAEETRPLASDPTGSELVTGIQSAVSEEAHDDPDLINAINDLTSAPPTPPANVRHGNSRKERQQRQHLLRSLQRRGEGTGFSPFGNGSS